MGFKVREPTLSSIVHSSIWYSYKNYKDCQLWKYDPKNWSAWYLVAYAMLIIHWWYFIFFYKIQKSSIKQLKLILYIFKLAICMSINFQKIQLIGLEINDDLTADFAIRLGCQVAKLSIHYLDILLYHSKLSKRDWSFLIEKIFKKLCK